MNTEEVVKVDDESYEVIREFDENGESLLCLLVEKYIAEASLNER